MTGTIVVAVARNGVIGRDNGLPWHLPGDLPRFKKLTLGRTLLMGRRTFDSIGRPLPGRQTVVLTRQLDWSHPGVEVVHSVDDARRLLANGDVVVAGGGELYRELLNDVDRLEITEVHRDVEGDTYFPSLAPADWVETAREEQDGFGFVTYQRRRSENPGGETDLAVLLAGLRPEADPTDFVFVTVPAYPLRAEALDVTVQAMVREAEGVTLVVSQADADRAGWTYEMVTRRVTLRVHSSLAAVGMTAAFAAALAARQIPANVVAGYFHDHLYVPADRVDDAVTALQALAHRS